MFIDQKGRMSFVKVQIAKKEGLYGSNITARRQSSFHVHVS